MKLLSLSLLLVLSAAVVAQSPPANGKGIGKSSAPILIEVYSDYQCPHCKILYEETLRPLIRDYVNTGKVYLLHRDFPLPRHAYAKKAASYACAAARVGKYEQVSDVLFRTQTVWSDSGKVEETACSVLSPAEAKTVRTLAQSPEIAAEIQRDIDQGTSANLQQTPTMILTHKMRRYPVPGAVNYSIFRKFLDNLLAQ